jgi:hypothetical protein
MNTDSYERFKSLTGSHCWQYEIRLQNRKKDVLQSGLSKKEINKLRVEDFYFEHVGKENKNECAKIKTFIENHEFLGKLPNRPTHRFVARLKKNNLIAGAVIMATPNAFSHLLGKENQDKEKLISRGACISWAPKNLGSWLIMQSVKWMVKNTQFRYFTAYSDPEAKELGTIYQACNFYYLGQTSGTNFQYLDPASPEKGWFSDREFRKKSKYRRYATEIGISKEKWKKWMNKYSPNWDLIPPDIKKKIKEQEKKYRDGCKSRRVPPKHKYCYILGRTKAETKKFKKLFKEKNAKSYNLSYPTERGK